MKGARRWRFCSGGFVDKTVVHSKISAMSMVTISKREYRELVEKKLRYDYLHQVIVSDVFSLPPVRSRKSVLKAFSGTKKYNKKFLKSLARGLERSTYFKA